MHSAQNAEVSSHPLQATVPKSRHGEDTPIRSATSHFFLPPRAASSFRSHVTTFPSITTPLPSTKATRDRPSQFLKVSHTKGCCGWKVHCAISFDFSAWGSSIFLPPVSLPIFQESFEIRQAERPHRTKPIGE